MSATCNGCGNCCDPVVLPYTQREIAMKMPGELEFPADRRHVLENLTPVPRGVALKRWPWLRQTTTSRDGSPDGGANTYTCRHFDPITRGCDDYENRPPLCRDFPWYGLPPNHRAALPPDCSYIEDVPVELRRVVRVL